MAESNLYETLGVPKDAPPDEIRRAYKKAALQTHPDRLGPNITPAEKAAAEERFRMVNHAYEVLNDSGNRKIYDLYGRWPPPNATEETQARANAEPWGHAFDSQFRNDPFNFPDPFGGSRRHFAFTDPFELFNSIFGDVHRRPFGGSPFDDPLFDDFPSTFGGARRSRDPFDAFGAPFGGLLGGSMFSPFGPMADSSRNGSMRTASFTSMGFSDGQENRWVSQSRMTRTINGVTESVWKRTDSDGNEHVTLTYPDGQQRYTINGVEQTQNNGYLQNPPQEPRSDRYLPPPAQQGPLVIPGAPPSYHSAEHPRSQHSYEQDPRRSSVHSNTPSHHSHHSHHSQPSFYAAARPRGGYAESSHRNSYHSMHLEDNERVIPDARYPVPTQGPSKHSSPSSYAPPPEQYSQSKYSSYHRQRSTTESHYYS